MATRWRMLAVLFTVRTAMAFQFQAVAALSPAMMDRFGVGLSEIGVLIGLYLAPGIVLALPGGALGKRFGDARVVAAGLAAMALGGALMAWGASWEAQIAGRLLAGAGGVALNVLMTKMVADWFAGGDLATAMAIFVNSWPVGIALALIALPAAAGVVGLTVTFWVVAALALGGFVLILRLYRAPPAADAGPAPKAGRLSPLAVRGATLSGGIWGLYNGALAMVFGFGTALLTERGWTETEASAATSLALWAVALSIPFGGLIADRTGRRDATVALGLVLFAIALGLAAGGGPVLVLFALAGLAAGIPAGPIMSLPAETLAPHERARGMGLFFTLFYLSVVLAPIAAGWLAEAVGTAGAAFWFGVGLLILCLPLLSAHRALVRTSRAEASRA